MFHFKILLTHVSYQLIFSMLKKKLKKKNTSYPLSYKCYSQLFKGLSFTVLKRGCIVVKHIFCNKQFYKRIFPMSSTMLLW